MLSKPRACGGWSQVFSPGPHSHYVWGQSRRPCRQARPQGWSAAARKVCPRRRWLSLPRAVLRSAPYPQMGASQLRRETVRWWSLSVLGSPFPFKFRGEHPTLRSRTKDITQAQSDVHCDYFRTSSVCLWADSVSGPHPASQTPSGCQLARPGRGRGLGKSQDCQPETRQHGPCPGHPCPGLGGRGLSSLRPACAGSCLGL